MSPVRGALQLADVTVRYGDVLALDAVDLTVEAGSVTALVGPSGCGKTTLLSVVAGLTRPTAGAVHLDGRDLSPIPADRREAVLVFQEHRLFPFLTALDDVAFGLRMRGVARREREARAAEMLARVGLAGLEGRRPSELSGGQRQRVALARALVLDPAVLLLDEPLSSLDPHLREDVRELIGSLQRERALTTLVVTHDREEAVAFGDRLAVLLDGRLHQHATPREVVERPATAAVARFLGRRGLLPGRRHGAVVTTAAGDLPLPAAAVEALGAVEDVEVVLRPDRLRLLPRGDSADGAGTTALAGRVELTHYLGTRSRATVEVAGCRIEVEGAPDDLSGLGAGAEVEVVVPVDAVWAVPAPGAAPGAGP